MRLEATNSEHRTKVWLTDDDLILQLGGYVGLRSFEIPQVQPRHIKESEGGQYRLRVPAGKDRQVTAGSRVARSCRATSSGICSSSRTSATSRRRTPSSIRRRAEFALW